MKRGACIESKLQQHQDKGGEKGGRDSWVHNQRKSLPSKKERGYTRGHSATEGVACTDRPPQQMACVPAGANQLMKQQLPVAKLGYSLPPPCGLYASSATALCACLRPESARCWQVCAAQHPPTCPHQTCCQSCHRSRARPASS